MSDNLKPFSVSTQIDLWNDKVITLSLGRFHAQAIVDKKQTDLQDVVHTLIKSLLFTITKDLINGRMKALYYTGGGEAKIAGIKNNEVYKNLRYYTERSTNPFDTATNLEKKLLPLLNQAMPNKQSHYYNSYQFHYSELVKLINYIYTALITKAIPLEAQTA